MKYLSPDMSLMYFFSSRVANAVPVHPRYKRGRVGFTTADDTIEFEGEGQLSFTIVSISPDSITIKRPELHTETLLPYKGRKKVQRLSVEKYEYRKYALEDITTFQYPSKADEDEGCMACMFLMAMPGVNVWLYYKLRKRYHPSNYKMSDGWKFHVKRVNPNVFQKTIINEDE
jgi:hypothetical protein